MWKFKKPKKPKKPKLFQILGFLKNLKNLKLKKPTFASPDIRSLGYRLALDAWFYV